MPNPDWLSADDARFVVAGQSITLASRDMRHVPSISRGLACRFSDDGTQFIVLLSSSQSETLLVDVARTSQIAVVITNPLSHHTLQIKGCDAVVAPTEGDDLAVVDASRRHFGAIIKTLGYAEDYNNRLFHAASGDVCRIIFTPDDIYQQTPGPDAGKRIGPKKQEAPKP